MVEKALEKKKREERSKIPASASTHKASKKGALTAPTEELARKKERKDKAENKDEEDEDVEKKREKEEKPKDEELVCKPIAFEDRKPCLNENCSFLEHSMPLTEEGDCTGYCCWKCMGRDNGEDWAVGGKNHYKHCEKTPAKSQL